MGAGSGWQRAGSPARCHRQARDTRQTLDLLGTGLPLNLAAVGEGRLEPGPRLVKTGGLQRSTRSVSSCRTSGRWTPGWEQLDTPTTDPRRPDVDTGRQTGSTGPASQASLVLCAHPEDTERSSKEPGTVQNATAGDSNHLETLNLRSVVIRPKPLTAQCKCSGEASWLTQPRAS